MEDRGTEEIPELLLHLVVLVAAPHLIAIHRLVVPEQHRKGMLGEEQGQQLALVEAGAEQAPPEQQPLALQQQCKME